MSSTLPEGKLEAEDIMFILQVSLVYLAYMDLTDLQFLLLCWQNLHPSLTGLVT